MSDNYTFTFNGLLGNMTCTCLRCGCVVNPNPDTIKIHDKFHTYIEES